MDQIKLCDFGSISNKVINFSKLTKEEKQEELHEYEKTTTLMYRPPEMCDPYLNYLIGEQVDMWMIGCVCFTLMFFKHPFYNASKVGIINASVIWPEEKLYS
jgi:AP2-associated kinase